MVLFSEVRDFLKYIFYWFIDWLIDFLFSLFKDAPMAYGGSQAKGLIGAVAAGLHHSHSNARSEPNLWPTPLLTAMPDPQPIERGQGSNPQTHDP